MFRRVDSKSPSEIVSEWDVLAPVRYQQISSGEDLTFRHVLAPTIVGLVSREPAERIVDAGCGIGVLTDLLAQDGKRVTGVDPSGRSIAIARANFGTNAEFVESTLESYAERSSGFVDLMTANMVLMDVLDLQAFLCAAYALLRPGGVLVFSITHPWFWPAYYGYSEEPWFDYKSEIIIESPFRISAQPDGALPSTHVHRPLDAYSNALKHSNFSLESLLEPMPPQEINHLYPRPWRFPRYLVGTCRR